MENLENNPVIFLKLYVELPQLNDEIKVQNKELWKEKQELGPEWEDSLKENLMCNSINTILLLVHMCIHKIF